MASAKQVTKNINLDDTTKVLSQDEVNQLLEAIVDSENKPTAQNSNVNQKSSNIYPNSSSITKNEIVDFNIWKDQIVYNSNFINTLTQYIQTQDDIVHVNTFATKYGTFKEDHLKQTNTDLIDSSIRASFENNLGFFYIFYDSAFITRETCNPEFNFLNQFSSNLNLDLKIEKYLPLNLPNHSIIDTEAVWVIEVHPRIKNKYFLIIPLFVAKGLDHFLQTKLYIFGKNGDMTNMKSDKAKSSLVQGVIGSCKLTQEQLQNLKDGDILVFEENLSESIEIKSKGKTIAIGYPVVIGEKLGLRVIRKIK